MKDLTKKEEMGTQGVNASQTIEIDPKNNGQKNFTFENGLPIKKDEKPAKEPIKAKTIEEQMSFFDGLANLVNIKRRFETHKQAIGNLAISDEELAKFESEKRYGVRIVLHDDQNNDYVINNPKLVKEVQSYLISVIESKISEYDQKITSYGV